MRMYYDLTWSYLIINRYLIKWADKEQQLKAEERSFNIPFDDETALLVTLQTMGEHILEYETLVQLRCANIDKQKEEALILIMVGTEQKFIHKNTNRIISSNENLRCVTCP